MNTWCWLDPTCCLQEGMWRAEDGSGKRANWNGETEERWRRAEEGRLLLWIFCQNMPSLWFLAVWSCCCWTLKATKQPYMFPGGTEEEDAGVWQIPERMWAVAFCHSGISRLPDSRLGRSQYSVHLISAELATSLHLQPLSACQPLFALHWFVRFMATIWLCSLTWAGACHVVGDGQRLWQPLMLWRQPEAQKVPTILWAWCCSITPPEWSFRMNRWQATQHCQPHRRYLLCSGLAWSKKGCPINKWSSSAHYHDDGWRNIRVWCCSGSHCPRSPQSPFRLDYVRHCLGTRREEGETWAHCEGREWRKWYSLLRQSKSPPFGPSNHTNTAQHLQKDCFNGKYERVRDETTASALGRATKWPAEANGAISRRPQQNAQDLERQCGRKQPSPSGG